MTAAPGVKVYLLPLVDVNWVNFAPMDRKKNFLHDPPPVNQCAAEVERCVEEMRHTVGGKVVFTVHSGTYCRKAFYEEPFLSYYRRAVGYGMEIAIHTHEEIAGKGTRNAEQGHMKGVILERKAELLKAGITPTTYRGGHFGYLEYLTPFLEQEGLLIDLSCAPGFNKPAWDAVWVDASFSAYYLCPENRTHMKCQHGASKVLEVPLGADGLGSENTNYLYNEESDDENLARVWDAIAHRADTEGNPQIVHMLFHSSSMGIPKYVDRFRRFIEYARKKGGLCVTPSEAKRIYDSGASASGQAKR